ncbi:hypothetical protein [Variovorax sp. PvP013]|uniref:hypothetical protein n=1 Tax=Variovorax sp. PvP013 TaxID=3156435 RepID=UPI003D24D25F
MSFSCADTDAAADFLSQPVAAGGGRIATAANKISSPPVEEALFAPYNRNRFEMRD